MNFVITFINTIASSLQEGEDWNWCNKPSDVYHNGLDKLIEEILIYRLCKEIYEKLTLTQIILHFNAFSLSILLIVIKLDVPVMIDIM